MEIKRIFDLLERYKLKYNKTDALVSKKKGKWVKVSSEKYIEESHLLSYSLLAKGYKKGDKIASISNNRPEWNILDMGMSMAGIIHVPIFSNLNAEEYEYIFNHSDIKALFISDKNCYKMILPAFNKCAKLKEIYSFDQVEGIPQWNDLIKLGNENKSTYEEQLEGIKASISEDDLATMIYTSGTTDKSKGVMLSHKNVVQNFLAAAKIFELKSDERYLSILPLCHVGGRMGNYQTQYSGTSVYYAENMGTIARNLKEIQPVGFDAVPRILEKIYDSIISKGSKLTGIKKKLFFWAVKVGLKYRISGSGLFFYNLKLKLADKLIFSKWRDAIGGNVRLVGCGGASLQPRLERIFWACGIKILNMYGLTETSPIITINRSSKPDVMLGSVGPVIDGVEVKIAEDGEILCKGHNVMMAYYKNEELSSSVYDKDGWFQTGDIGHLEDGRFLKVTDRKKEIFKLSNGKYISPQAIENNFKESLFVDQIMVVGEHEKFASALISPNFSHLNNWCKENNLDISDKSEQIKLQAILDVYDREVKKINKKLSSFERIKRFRLIPDEWAPNTGELSPTLKLKRKVVHQKYRELLEEVYIKKEI